MNAKSPRKLAEKAKKSEPRRQGEEGLAEAARKNREREARLRIIEAFGRLGISCAQWPDFVRVFYAGPQQRIEFHQMMAPPSFQAPDFDRLSQSRSDWVKMADRAWALHRDRFLQYCDDSVSAGVDEEIVEVKRTRGTANKVPKVRGRGANTPIDRRYEWAAKRLVKVPLKEIAGADADATTVGRVAREIIRLAGWATR